MSYQRSQAGLLAGRNHIGNKDSVQSNSPEITSDDKSQDSAFAIYLILDTAIDSENHRSCPELCFPSNGEYLEPENFRSECFDQNIVISDRALEARAKVLNRFTKALDPKSTAYCMCEFLGNKDDAYNFNFKDSRVVGEFCRYLFRGSRTLYWTIFSNGKEVATDGITMFVVKRNDDGMDVEVKPFCEIDLRVGA